MYWKEHLNDLIRIVLGLRLKYYLIIIIWNNKIYALQGFENDTQVASTFQVFKDKNCKNHHDLNCPLPLAAVWFLGDIAVLISSDHHLFHLIIDNLIINCTIGNQLHTCPNQSMNGKCFENGGTRIMHSHYVNTKQNTTLSYEIHIKTAPTVFINRLNLIFSFYILLVEYW